MKNYTIFGKLIPTGAVYYCKTMLKDNVVFLDENHNVMDMPVGYYTPSALEKFRENKKTICKFLRTSSDTLAVWCIVNDDLTGWINTHTGQVYMNDEVEPAPPLTPVAPTFEPKVGESCLYTAVLKDDKESIVPGQWYYCDKVVAYHDGYVWTSDNGIRRLDNTRFKPVPDSHKELETIILENHKLSARDLATLIINKGFTR
jgi:hypothetical protein